MNRKFENKIIKPTNHATKNGKTLKFCSFSKKFGFSTFFHPLLVCLVSGFYSHIFPRPVPQWLVFIDPPHHYSPSSPKRNNWQFSLFFISFLKVRDPHYICLFFIQILSILCNFVISNHENHIILFISEKIFEKNIFNKQKFQIWHKILPEIPRTPNLNPGNRF